MAAMIERISRGALLVVAGVLSVTLSDCASAQNSDAPSMPNRRSRPIVRIQAHSTKVAFAMHLRP